jgi:radical SAM superfamily enzyme YgiQ (UPF0313 family)
MSSRSADDRARVENLRLAKEERFLVRLPAGGDIRTVVAYPNRYWLAMSNLGFQAVYRLFAEQPRFSVERAYIPEDDDAAIKTFESNSHLSNAEILAVSVSFETDYPYVLRLLKEAGLNLEACQELDAKAAKRPLDSRPLIIGGGAALTLNPEPLANFFDVIVIGEGEEVVAEIAETYAAARDTGADEQTVLIALSKLEGVYIPSLYSIQYGDDDSIHSFVPDPVAPRRVTRRIVKDISAFPTATVIQTPNTEFKSMYMTETGRGCEVGCKFCVAGYMYRPIRKRSTEALEESVKIGLESGESIGFVGASVSSHRSIAKLAGSVAAQGKRAALSSIMSQKVTPELAASLTESEYKTVALAPEAGNEQLRFCIGKRVRDEQVINAIGTLAGAGIRNFKLYFMVGLPSEEESDVESIISLVERARAAAFAAARTQEEFLIAPKIILSVNPFIPKAWTPFQRHPFLGFSEIKRRIRLVKRGVARLGSVEMKHESPRESYFQTVLSRGDRRVGDMLYFLHEHGHDWRWLVKNGSQRFIPNAPSPDFYVMRAFSRTELLPWEIVDLNIKRTLLDRLYEETFEEDVTPLIAREYPQACSQAV